MRTWAPKGRTPLLRSRLTRDHLSAISAVTPEGDLFMQVRERSFKGPDVVRFLKHLLSHLGFRLLVIWDGGPIHRARVVKEYLAFTNGRIQVEQLPAYAPDLNPDEGIWRYLKYVELRNVRCQDLGHLRRTLRLAVERLRHKRHVIRGCFKHAGYSV